MSGVTVGPAERIEDLEFMDETGVTATEAAERGGFASAEAMEKWLERHDAYDLWLSFKKREVPGTHSEVARRAAKPVESIAALITSGQKSTRKRTRNKADRISEMVSELRSTLRAEIAEDESTAEARAEIERLERELAKAKGRLRGVSSAYVATVQQGPSAADIRAWAAANNVDCTPVGRVPGAVRDAFLAATTEQVA